MKYEDLAARLPAETATLFREMVTAHLDAGSGDRYFMLVRTFQSDLLQFSGGGPHIWEGVDLGALQDLAGYGLLRVEQGSRGTARYRVTAEGLAYHRWLMQQLGAPIDQARDDVHRVVTGDVFAERHFSRPG